MGTETAMKKQAAVSIRAGRSTDHFIKPERLSRINWTKVLADIFCSQKSGCTFPAIIPNPL